MSHNTTSAISIAATFTAEPLSPSLSLILEHVGLSLELRFAPYNQLFQQLLSESGLLADNKQGINLILIRIEDFVRDITDTALIPDAIIQTTRELTTALTTFSHRAKVPTIVSILSPSPERDHPFESDLYLASRQLTLHARSLPGLILLFPEEVSAALTQPTYDRISDDLAHIPYSKEYYASLGLAIARKVHAILVPAHKVLVLDCDNTLWRGVVGEDGLEGIAISPEFAQLQKFAVNAHLEGALVCLVSKNVERDVLEVFEKRSDMVLRLDHVVAHRINWEPKPQNILSLAQSLNLGLESFVFLDDNPVECGLMRTELPQVVTLQIPPEEKLASFLVNLWTFDKLSVTDEDARRTQMYKENFARQELEDSSKDIGDFISSLNVAIDIGTPAKADWPRLSQLTQRTNQFNFSTKRRSETELRAMETDGSTVLRINVKDRFGDYGLVGMVIAENRSDRLFVDTFLLSCRVLGRGVEHAVLQKLGELAKALNLPLVVIPFLPTAKNEPARAFIESVAARYKTNENDRITFSIPSDAASTITHRPGCDPVEVINASKSIERTEKSQTATVASRSERYSILTQDLITGRAIEKAVRARLVRERSLQSKAVPANSEVEHKMLQLWEAVLAIHGLGIDDDYFAIGGTSLLAAQLFAEIARQFKVRLPLTTILTSPTVRTLSLQIHANEASVKRGLLELKPGQVRNLFLVHDGDGETLLYSNLARRLPDEMAVFGINPHSIPKVPLAHTSIKDMASFYLEMVRKRQSRGPYFLGGMCAGGVIAYEMANQLIEQGETIGFVVLFDAATPQAARRTGRITKQRLGRLSQLVKECDDTSFAKRARILVTAAARKALNTIHWELTSRLRKWSVLIRFRFLQQLLKRKSSWPSRLPGLTVRQIYESAEALYVPAALKGPKIILMRATTGEAGDTPYTEIYSDPTFGWGTIAQGLVAIDVRGGHYSMLQEPAVAHLADLFTGILDSESEPCRASSKIDEPA
jgi:FkbH-like protein